MIHPHDIMPSRHDDQLQEDYEDVLADHEEAIWVSFKDVHSAETFIDENIADPQILLAQIFQAVSLNGFAEIENLINKHVTEAAKNMIEREIL